MNALAIAMIAMNTTATPTKNAPKATTTPTIGFQGA